MIDMSTPQGRVAQQFMDHKGLGHLRPCDVDKLEDQPCWYFYYELPEGELELEVYWDHNDGTWETMVTTFTLAS
jgi:hypothetical protein